MTQPLSENFLSIHSAATQSLRLWSSDDELELLVRRSVKVFRANRTTMADGVAQRLENLFWRIWSNRKLMHNISTAQLERMFTLISQGGQIRTTPTSSPQHPVLSQAEQECNQEPPLLTLDGSRLPLPHDESISEPDQAPTPTPSSPFAHLKRPKERRSQAANDSQIPLADGFDSRGRSGGSSAGLAAPASPPTDTSRRKRDDGGSVDQTQETRFITGAQDDIATNRTKAGILTNPGGQRRKPSFIRRRSSQTSRLKVSFKTDSQMKHSDNGRCRPQRAGSESEDPGIVGRTPQWQREIKETPEDVRSGRAGSISEEILSPKQDQAASLINHQASSSSSRTLPVTAGKAAVAAAAAASFQASGVLDFGQLAELDLSRADEAESLGDEGTNTAATFKRRPPAAPPPLPGRTRSQLTELLERKRMK